MKSSHCLKYERKIWILRTEFRSSRRCDLLLCDNYLPKCLADLSSNSRVIFDFFLFWCKKKIDGHLVCWNSNQLRMWAKNCHILICILPLFLACQYRKSLNSRKILKYWRHSNSRKLLKFGIWNHWNWNLDNLLKSWIFSLAVLDHNAFIYNTITLHLLLTR